MIYIYVFRSEKTANRLKTVVQSLWGYGGKKYFKVVLHNIEGTSKKYWALEYDNKAFQKNNSVMFQGNMSYLTGFVKGWMKAKGVKS